ncbi:hypothetical protein HDK77DRAFT_265558 [Phyllosticta capitalensis]
MPVNAFIPPAGNFLQTVPSQGSSRGQAARVPANNRVPGQHPSVPLYITPNVPRYASGDWLREHLRRTQNQSAPARRRSAAPAREPRNPAPVPAQDTTSSHTPATVQQQPRFCVECFAVDCVRHCLRNSLGNSVVPSYRSLRSQNVVGNTPVIHDEIHNALAGYATGPARPLLPPVDNTTLSNPRPAPPGSALPSLDYPENPLPDSALPPVLVNMESIDFEGIEFSETNIPYISRLILREVHRQVDFSRVTVDISQVTVAQLATQLALYMARRLLQQESHARAQNGSQSSSSISSGVFSEDGVDFEQPPGQVGSRGFQVPWPPHIFPLRTGVGEPTTGSQPQHAPNTTELAATFGPWNSDRPYNSVPEYNAPQQHTPSSASEGWRSAQGNRVDVDPRLLTPSPLRLSAQSGSENEESDSFDGPGPGDGPTDHPQDAEPQPQPSVFEDSSGSEGQESVYPRSSYSASHEINPAQENQYPDAPSEQGSADLPPPHSSLSESSESAIRSWNELSAGNSAENSAEHWPLTEPPQSAHSHHNPV